LTWNRRQLIGAAVAVVVQPVACLILGHIAGDTIDDAGFAARSPRRTNAYEGRLAAGLGHTIFVYRIVTVVIEAVTGVDAILAAVAAVTGTVFVAIELIRVGMVGAVVTEITDPIEIQVRLIRVGVRRTDIAGVADPIPIFVRLVGVGHPRAAITGAIDAVIIVVDARQLGVGEGARITHITESVIVAVTLVRIGNLGTIVIATKAVAVFIFVDAGAQGALQGEERKHGTRSARKSNLVVPAQPTPVGDLGIHG